MASAYLVTQPNTEVLGTTGNDTIDFRTANGVTIRGLDGNDAISADAQAANTLSASNAVLAGNGGNDTFSLSAIQGTNFSIFGGAGNDLISAANLSAAAAIMQGGGGADTVQLTAGLVAARYTVGLNDGADVLRVSGFNGQSATIAGGAGNDSITFSAIAADVGSNFFGGGGADSMNLSAVGSLNTTNIDGGAGNDTITADIAVAFGTATINGGDGADVINISAAAFSGGSRVLGDTVGSTGTGADTITVDITGSDSGSTIQGAGGADQITYSGGISEQVVIGGNFGKDVLDINSVATSGLTVNGGAGSDTIELLNASNVASGYVAINGGGGGDVISGTIAAGEGTNSVSATTIAGGAGADSITLRQAVGSGALFTYGAATDSNVTSYDIISSTTVGALSGNLVFNTTAIGTPAVQNSNIQVSGAVAGQTLTIASGGAAAAFRSTFGGNWSLSDRVSAIGAQLSTKGQFTHFTDGTNTYLFVQGGSAGTSDDLLVGFTALGDGGSGATTQNAAFSAGFITIFAGG